MSLKPQDLIRLPYDDSLTLAGVTYACRSMHYCQSPNRRVSAHRIRRSVATVAAELAFRRWLDSEDVPYGLIQATPFTRPNHYTITVGGRRLDVRLIFITSRQQIRRLRQDPSWLLQIEALIPIDQLTSDFLSRGDPYAFVIIAGLETRTQAELQRALAAAQPSFLIAIPPVRAWRQIQPKRSLGQLMLRNNDPQSIDIELGGQLADRRLISERLTLLPGQQTELPIDLASVLYIHSTRPLAGIINVHSPTLRRTWSVGPQSWSNIWIYGLEVFLAGWCTKRAFQSRAHFLPAGSQTRLGRRTRNDSRALPISQLRPIRELVERIDQR